ncbi:MAG: RNA polymerase sigma factor [Verrucomicrobiia bacterium]|jgi:RNA polymerase sigma-70 factor (ECF subfamily)
METKAETAKETGEDVFEKIYRQNVRSVYYYALRMLGDPSAAEDATHDVFLKAYKNFDQFRNESSPRTWLYRITINHCNNLLKSKVRHYTIELNETDIGQLSDSFDSPLKVVENKDLGEIMQKTLDKLPPEYKAILLLSADENLSYSEIARLTSQTVDAVRGKLHRARKLFIYHFKQANL